MKENRKDWCKLPYAVILDERLTPADAVVYAVLSDMAKGGEVDIRIGSISQLTGLSPRQIHYSIDRLKKAGYVLSAKSTGRKLVIELEQVLPEKQATPESSRKRSSDPEPTENPDYVEEALIGILTKKIAVKDERYVRDVYNDLKTQALASVRDHTKVLSYLSKMISNYVDKSDGFNPYEYEDCINNF